MTDDEVATVLALVRLHVAQTARTWVVSHVQVRGKRKREVLTWDGIRTPSTYTYVDCYQRWLPGRKKILRSLALTCKQETLLDPNLTPKDLGPGHSCTARQRPQP